MPVHLFMKSWYDRMHTARNTERIKTSCSHASMHSGRVCAHPSVKYSCFFEFVSPKILTAGSKRYKNHIQWNSILVSLHTQGRGGRKKGKCQGCPTWHMLTERVNKRHCGMEEKPTSVLDGGGKKQDGGKKNRKRNRFQSPHSTWRQEVKRKRFWQGVLVGVAVSAQG